MRVTFDADGHAIARFDLDDVFTLLVHDEVGNGHRGLDQNLTRPVARALFFDLTQDLQRHVVVRTDQTGAMTGRARLCRRFDHARAQTLARHFQQTETRDATHLNAGTVGFQLVFQALFNSGVVLALVHIDEVDDDQTGKVAQTQLARHFFGGLKVGLKRGFLDRTFFRGTTRVHVNRHKRFGHADHDVATGFQLDRRVKHATKVAFHLITRKERQRIRVVLHVLGVGRHDHFHEVLGRAVAAFTLDKHFVDVAVVQVTDRPFDQVAFFIDLGRRNRLQRQFADLFPQTLKVFVVALDLGLGALGTRSPDDQARTLRYVDGCGDFFQFGTVGSVGDLAADTATTGRVRHQNAVTASKAEVGCQGSAFVATLFLDDLHQHDLANLDHFLDFVTTCTRLARRADFFLRVVIGDRLDAVVVGNFYLRLVIFVFVGLCLVRGTVFSRRVIVGCLGLCCGVICIRSLNLGCLFGRRILGNLGIRHSVLCRLIGNDLLNRLRVSHSEAVVVAIAVVIQIDGFHTGDLRRFCRHDRISGRGLFRLGFRPARP